MEVGEIKMHDKQGIFYLILLELFSLICRNLSFGAP